MDPRDARDAHPPPRVQILSFLCSFRKNNRLAHLHLELAPPLPSGNTGSATVNAVADLRGGARDVAPPGGPNSFNFMQFLGKFGKIVCLPPPGGGGAPSWKSSIRHSNGPMFTIGNVLKFAIKWDRLEISEFLWFASNSKLRLIHTKFKILQLVSSVCLCTLEAQLFSPQERRLVYFIAKHFLGTLRIFFLMRHFRYNLKRILMLLTLYN